MANGQAESAVKNLKSKMKLLSMENSATGFSPAELIMGRPVVYPFELRQSDIDFSGNCIKKKLKVSYFLGDLILRN